MKDLSLPSPHRVIYDDGDKEWTHLAFRRFRIPGGAGDVKVKNESNAKVKKEYNLKVEKEYNSAVRKGSKEKKESH